MNKPPRRPGESEEPASGALRAGMTYRRQPIAADRAVERHLRTLSRRPGDAKILSRLPDAVVAFDRDWRYVFMNRQAEQNHRRPASDFLGHVIWELYPEAKGHESHRRYLEAMETQEAAVYEEYVSLLGRWFEQRLFPSPDGLTVIARDITRWRQVQRERAQLASDLAKIQVRGVTERNSADGAVPAPRGSNPLRTFSTFFPRPGCREALVARLYEAGFVAGAVEGAKALSAELQESADPSGPVVLTALWRDAAQYALWENLPERATILAAFDELVQEICVEKYEVLGRSTAE